MDEERLRNHVLNALYTEMKQANVNRIYATLLIDKQVFNSTLFNSLVAGLSAGGAILALVSMIIPIITSGLAALALAINQFHPVFFLKTDDLTRLISLQTDYNIYFDKIRCLFNLTDADGKTPLEAQEELSKLIEDNASKETEIGKLFGKLNKDLEKEAIAKSEEYLNAIYHANEK